MFGCRCFDRYFMGVSASHLRNQCRREDRRDDGTLTLKKFMEVVFLYLPSGRDAAFQDWLLEEYCNDGHKKEEEQSESSKLTRPIDYQAFTERIRQLEIENERSMNQKDSHRQRSMVSDFHTFEYFFRARCAE